MFTLYYKMINNKLKYFHFLPEIFAAAEEILDHSRLTLARIFICKKNV